MKKFFSVSLIFIVVITLSGCATSLSTKGASIRITSQPEDVKGCEYLGQLTSSSSWGGFAATGLGFESAMNELKNKAAQMGANTLLTQLISNTMGGTRMIGDAYKCNNKKE